MVTATPEATVAADAEPPNVVQQTPNQQTPNQQPQVTGAPHGAPATPIAAVGNGVVTRPPTQRALTYTNSPQRPVVNAGKGLIKAVSALGRNMGPEGILKEFEWQKRGEL